MLYAYYVDSDLGFRNFLRFNFFNWFFKYIYRINVTRLLEKLGRFFTRKNNRKMNTD